MESDAEADAEIAAALEKEKSKPALKEVTQPRQPIRKLVSRPRVKIPTPPPQKSPTPPPPPTPLPEFIQQFIGTEWFERYFPNCNEMVSNVFMIVFLINTFGFFLRSFFYFLQINQYVFSYLCSLRVSAPVQLLGIKICLMCCLFFLVTLFDEESSKDNACFLQFQCFCNSLWCNFQLNEITHISIYIILIILETTLGIKIEVQNLCTPVHSFLGKFILIVLNMEELFKKILLFDILLTSNTSS